MHSAFTLNTISSIDRGITVNTAKVFFTNMRTKFDESLLVKMDRLIQKAGIGGIDFSRKFTAIKIHFGEPGNLAFLRPNFAKVVADRIKAKESMKKPERDDVKDPLPTTGTSLFLSPHLDDAVLSCGALIAASATPLPAWYYATAVALIGR